MIIPIFINMPKFYADVVLVPLGFLAMAIAIARSLDALSDPLMGWISDHTHTRLGRRRPYMLIGAPLCGVAFFCLLNPPAALHGWPRGDLVRRNLHPLFHIPHDLRSAALRARPRADAELQRPLEPVRVARVVHHPGHDRGRRRAGRHDEGVASD